MSNELPRDAYSTYIGAKAVAFCWIGAAFGPAFVAIGIAHGRWAHLTVGGIGVLLACISVADGMRAMAAGSRSDFLALAVTPGVLLVLGIALAWIASLGTN